MHTADIKLPLAIIDRLFPVKGDEGQNVKPTSSATSKAAAELDVPWQEIRWVAPDVFSVRYGSSWVATAFSNDGRRVRFHTRDEGDFREEDASGFEEEVLM